MISKFQWQGETPDINSLEIKGERVILLPMSQDFADVIYMEFNETITRYMIPSPAKNLEEAREFIDMAKAGMAGERELVFVVTDKNARFLGCVGLHGTQSVKRPELGVWIKASEHGLGYGREAVHTLFHWALNVIHFDFALYPVSRNNWASRKIPESLNGTLYGERLSKTMSGCILDEVVYKVSG